jgi:serine acetyltransferase
VVSGNCVIARNTLLEDEVFVGTNSYIRENLHVGKSAKVMAGAVVVADVSEGAAVSGNFAIAHERRLKEFALSRAR